MKHYINQKNLSYIMLIASCPLLVLSTNPQSLPIPLMIVPYLWLMVVLPLALRFCLRKLAGSDITAHQMLVIMGASSLVVMLALLQSLNQLSIRDVLLSLALVLAGSVYAHYVAATN